MGIYEKCKRVLGDRWEEFLDTYMAVARSDPAIKAEWREACGVQTDEEIDYNNPIVEISYNLCDIRNMRLIYKGRHREEFLEKLSPEARIVYFEPMEDGSSFLDMEKPHVFKALMRNMRKSISKFFKKLLKDGKIKKSDFRKAEAEARSITISENETDLTEEDEEED